MALSPYFDFQDWKIPTAMPTTEMPTQDPSEKKNKKRKAYQPFISTTDCIRWNENKESSRQQDGLLCRDGIECRCLVSRRRMNEQSQRQVLYKFQHQHLLKVESLGIHESVAGEKSFVLAFHPSIRKMGPQDFKDLFRKNSADGKRVFTYKGRDFVVHLATAIENLFRFKDGNCFIPHFSQLMRQYTLDLSLDSIYCRDTGMSKIPLGSKRRFEYIIGDYLEESKCRREDRGCNFMRLGRFLQGLCNDYAVASKELCDDLCKKLRDGEISRLVDVEMHPATWSGYEAVAFILSADARVKDKKYVSSYRKAPPITDVSKFRGDRENEGLRDSVIIIRNIVCHPNTLEEPFARQDRPTRALRQIGKHCGYGFLVELAERFKILGHPRGM